jgi:hypothetical protein
MDSETSATSQAMPVSLSFPGEVTMVATLMPPVGYTVTWEVSKPDGIEKASPVATAAWHDA